MNDSKELKRLLKRARTQLAKMEKKKAPDTIIEVHRQHIAKLEKELKDLEEKEG